MKRFEGREKSHVWGKPKRSTVLFKYLKVRSYKGFFPGKLVNLLLVSGTISFYKPESENLYLLEKVLCGMDQCV